MRAMLTNKYEELFRENVIMTMDHLKLATGRPRESILRDLKRIGYYSSYNERGKFYTLDSIPEFNSLGLWNYQNAYFSIRRTLLDSIEYLVGESNAGYTHNELRLILGIEIQNSLYLLTILGKIVRRQVGGQYVYFGKDIVDEQWEKRSAMIVEPIIRKTAKINNTQSQPNIDPTVVIEILVAVLRGHETVLEAHNYLYQEGYTVTVHQVTKVFQHYNIGKKNSPAQK